MLCEFACDDKRTSVSSRMWLVMKVSSQVFLLGNGEHIHSLVLDDSATPLSKMFSV